MSWEKVKLGDIAEFSNGINFNKNAYAKGVKFISVSNFGDRFSPDYESLPEIKKDVVRANDYLEDGDIVFVRSNGNKELVGRCMLIQNAPYPVTYSGFCIKARLIDPIKYDSVFLTYHFKSKMFRQAMAGTAVGSNIQNLSQSRLTAYEFSVPTIGTQKKIADILLSYDNLIKNNQRQIKLLEETAQRLYKEWFVDLRFPRYEDAKIVDGVPVGWGRCKLSEIAPIVTGKKDANFGTEKGEYYFFTCAQEPIKAPAFSFDCDAVILAGNGDFNVKLYRGKFEAYQRTYVFSPFEKEDLYLLFYAVKENMRQLFQGASGSTIKFLTKGMLESILVYRPIRDVTKQFNDYCEKIQSKIEILKYQQQYVEEARDRLLPKLMNGEIEV